MEQCTYASEENLPQFNRKMSHLILDLCWSHVEPLSSFMKQKKFSENPCTIITICTYCNLSVK